MKTLSIIIPAYNEERFIGMVLEVVSRVSVDDMGFNKEIVVVNDGSTDKTSEIVKGFAGVKLIDQRNGGKGSAIMTGIRNCSGDYVLIQDADWEYDPFDYYSLLYKLKEFPGAAVYGSRILGVIERRGIIKLLPGKHPYQRFGPWMANIILVFFTYILYRTWITDTLTAYKLYPRDFFNGIDVKTKGFETEQELTGKLRKKGIPIYEVPINYNPRSVHEGKKIRARDGFMALWALFKFRFVN